MIIINVLKHNLSYKEDVIMNHVQNFLIKQIYQDKYVLKLILLNVKNKSKYSMNYQEHYQDVLMNVHLWCKNNQEFVKEFVLVVHVKLKNVKKELLELHFQNSNIVVMELWHIIIVYQDVIILQLYKQMKVLYVKVVVLKLILI